jgi:hypothetical protein
MNPMREATASLFALMVSVLADPAHAATPNWNQNANIKEAAGHLSKLHRAQGSQGVIKFLDACYRTHTLASEFNRGLEACMAQDYMHSQVLAVVYAKVPPEERVKSNYPSPDFIAKTMSARFSSVFAQYNVTTEQTDAFKKAVDTHGFPIFLKAVFPKDAARAGDKK